jgi:Tfp pilus assembly protein PilN
MRIAVALLTLASFGSILAVAQPQTESGKSQTQTSTKKTKKHSRKAAKKQKNASDTATTK